ncbi:uncharacterized protein BHQ10_010014 [Talaromyces amestolkiae]|uniref:Uncharacterized protein n=1 Tax=Talaromyces amestolkiae TaxID=1196081 RepID=A0A364LDY7_TALAM|nr:uncharacterized protein BHQ10_010014 [Talaromyces amestolkiae]RAO74002.1 hypothetical protein BHQ10_010014 [Talaromyces amestolkiae]
MPMQWTLANERLLFLRILELSNTTVDYRKVSETWPNEDERPTARAVSEHIFKLKKLAKSGSAGSSTAVSTPKTPRTKTITPRASGGTRASAGGSTAKSKRKRNAAADASDSDNEFKPVNSVRFKREEDIDDLGPLPEDTPSKRARKPTQHLNMTEYAESGTETDEDDKGSNRFSSVDPEYAPVPEEDTFEIPGIYE